MYHTLRNYQPLVAASPLAKTSGHTEIAQFTEPFCTSNVHTNKNAHSSLPRKQQRVNHLLATMLTWHFTSVLRVDDDK